MRVRSPKNWLFMLVMMAPLVAVNVLILHILVTQGLAAFLPQTPGLITHSEVVRKKNSYGFETHYTYAVQGVAYESSRYRYAQWSSSNKSRVEDFARRFAVGARVPVFYDPESPSDAVLVTGVDGMYLYLLLCVNTLNLAMLLKLRQALYGHGPGGLFGSMDTLDTLGPLDVGLMAAGWASFVLMIVMTFVMMFDPPLILPILAWGGVLTTGVVFAMRRRADKPLPAPALRRAFERAVRQSLHRSRSR